MNLIEVVSKFRTEADCLDYLESVRWPNGLCCIKCGEMNVYKFTTNATTRTRTNKKGETRTVVVPSRRLYECKAKGCGHQFSATTGTVFHDSHLSLIKWFMAVGLIVEAKKGMSALQVARHLNMESSYKTVWYLCHRIRKAMKDGGLLTGIVEVDETYLTPKKPRKGKPYVKKESRDVVLGMIERGGKLRLVPMSDSRMETIEPIMERNIDADAILQTDESAVYTIIGKRRFPGRHRMINHTVSYGVGDLHTNTVENAFSLLKKGVYGTFHKVSIKHLGRYCEEFSFRFNRRHSQKQLFDSTLKGLVKEENLTFKNLIASV
jgi:ISXO2 transposase-like protein/transposase-like zinc ribbon protein